ncbi:MAG: ATP-dependent DNA helicase [Rhodospirillaceae bacterium]|nr:ATP-dependent DNA helicase [Rhodospirillaceae bacterium]MDD9913030.1 ATP-dependent DNA helicase [Rhodospirillaceae bacterium]MDD9925606.1 ATP-dependent DNA helicase [Rhodospirillaceae bacterium]
MIPEAPVLVAGLADAVWLSADGEIAEISLKDAARRADDRRPILCHAPAVARRLDIARFPCFDVLELFAFVRPAAFCVPTVDGIAEVLDLAPPADATARATTLLTAVSAMLRELALRPRDRDDLPVAWAMARGGWSWGVAVLSALGEEADDRPRAPAAGLDVWRNLPEWQEHAPPPPPGNLSVTPADSRARLAALLGDGAESRPSQSDYASAVSPAFTPPDDEDSPNVVLAEAGTGVGKTLGYIAPASVWAERNEAPVWVSTYTRNLQHQIDQELDRLYPDPDAKRNKVVVRKGRENYLCLLNYEEAVRGVAVRGSDAIPLGLMARWAARTRDGDTNGGDFPAWLSDVLGAGPTTGLTDRRGECIYSACSHYSKCYIERGIRKARRADLVIANHALVMIHAARGMPDQGPTRFVFDEGHHVFDAADSAFSAHLTGLEGAELRRWLRGSEGRRRSRSRGLKRRVEDLLGNDEQAEKALDAILESAAILPGEGWRQRAADGAPRGPAETFLTAVRRTVYARVDNAESPFDLEVSVEEPTPELLSAAARLHEALGDLARPLRKLRERLMARLDAEADKLDSTTRNRIEAIARSLKHRGEDIVEAWRFMLATLPEGTPPEHADWFSVERIDGRDFDVGMHRHWVDPTLPFAEVVLNQSQGTLITSATLMDGSGDPDADWQAAEARTGAEHLAAPAIRSAVPSPFDYAEQTRVFVVNDVKKTEMEQVAAAYRVLFLAAGGGGLGLFTAIGRLRAAYRRLAAPLDAANIPLYAQHVDALNLATLVDIFRAEENSCLLGTDAVRDGVDVPGRALRLIVFDRVPWPRPTIMHRARRKAFGARAYDDMITRLRLKQAYGRLVRRATDRGVFVLLDSRMPSRLAGAFPEGVEIERVGLAEAVAETTRFLETSAD